jgi:hypothetical protein
MTLPSLHDGRTYRRVLDASLLKHCQWSDDAEESSEVKRLANVSFCPSFMLLGDLAAKECLWGLA